MTKDPGMNYLNGLLDACYLAELRQAALDRAESELEDLEEQSSAAAGAAQSRYENGLLVEAWSIARGTSAVAPTAEHLRVVFSRLWTEPGEIGESELF